MARLQSSDMKPSRWKCWSVNPRILWCPAMMDVDLEAKDLVQTPFPSGKGRWATPSNGAQDLWSAYDGSWCPSLCRQHLSESLIDLGVPGLHLSAEEVSRDVSNLLHQPSHSPWAQEHGQKPMEPRPVAIARLKPECYPWDGAHSLTLSNRLSWSPL